jgi:hypothetical protein
VNFSESPKYGEAVIHVLDGGNVSPACECPSTMSLKYIEICL